MNAPENTDLIKLDAIKKVFFTDELETHALSDVHLSIRRGEYVAIEGPSGSGKTTLLSILGLLDVPTAGVYLLGGQSMVGLNARQRARIRRWLPSTETVVNGTSTLMRPLTRRLGAAYTTPRIFFPFFDA